MNLRSQLSDEALVDLIREGDEEAFISLYRRRQPDIYRFVFGMSNSRVTTEDVTQEVFINLIHHADRFDPARGSVRSFLYGIARNCLLQHFDRERPYVPYDVEVPENGSSALQNALRPDVNNPLAELTTAELLDDLRQAVLTLPLKYREAIVLCDLQEMDYVDAATVMRCPVGTVRSRLHRGRELLLQKLKSSVAVNDRAVRKRACC
jgi:RNA polymerase sigma-70 factor (ECF subfamily)